MRIREEAKAPPRVRSLRLVARPRSPEPSARPSWIDMNRIDLILNKVDKYGMEGRIVESKGERLLRMDLDRVGPILQGFVRLYMGTHEILPQENNQGISIESE